MCNLEYSENVLSLCSSRADIESDCYDECCLVNRQSGVLVCIITCAPIAGIIAVISITFQVLETCPNIEVEAFDPAAYLQAGKYIMAAEVEEVAEVTGIFAVFFLDEFIRESLGYIVYVYIIRVTEQQGDVTILEESSSDAEIPACKRQRKRRKQLGVVVVRQVVREIHAFCIYHCGFGQQDSGKSARNGEFSDRCF